MSRVPFAFPAVTLAALLLGGCATTYGGPPRPRYAGETFRQHVHRCLRTYPRYNPNTDRIERPDGPVPCPL